MNENELENEITGLTGFEIAVIGMSGRFPGAGDIEEFWDNLKNGREGISFFSDEELQETGVPDKLLNNPQYVKTYGWLEEIFCFDAEFFGFTPLEAEIMDPQVRLFHQCAYEALEDAGYDASTYKKLIGIYAGASASFDWQARVELSGKSRIFGWFAAKQLTDKDFLSTRVAYNLSLKGPAVTVDTACSTSLTAIHLACQGLIGGDCDMALAGGVTVPLIIQSGYLYQEGMINASDGHCRAFDARADGSNFGNAVAIVVLKRYTDAAADGDNIYAMIKGSALNNDGDRKAAYTAPSIDGQAGVIRTALRMAEVDPETITYVETHGTGTTLGDPVEIEGLKAAFNTKKKHFCRIGSVKTNVGHLEMASGVTGFIKTVLALKHRQIPPSLYFETPNPKIDFDNSPFVVNTQLTEWKRLEPGLPLRAGVSSFGIGGTNAHVILEEAPTAQSAERKAQSAGRQHQLILLSAKTETALEQMTQNLARYLQKYPDIRLADAAYTLQVGREVFPYRRMLVCPGNDTRKAVDLLSPESRKVKTYKSLQDGRPIIFMFSGLGGQYVNMGRDLYQYEPIFRSHMDRCFEILNHLVDYDIKEILYPRPDNSPLERGVPQGRGVLPDINQTEISQVVVFIFEYALAQLLMAWGIKPYALIGYSFGEYTAACISGVFSLKDGLKLVVSRGQLLQETPPGVMLSVPLPCEEITPLLNSNAGLSLSIDNGPSCVVSGPNALIDMFEKKMKEKRGLCMRVPAERAIHSHMMDTAAKKLAELLDTIPLNKPNIPYVSNVTGDWLTEQEAVSPGYWARHLRETVRFADGMKTLLKQPGAVLIELGPGRDISTLALRYLENDNDAQSRVLNLVRPQHQDISDVYFLLNRMGRLWMLGQPIDWDRFYGEEKKQRQRISLPTYPFERQEYRIKDEEISTGTKMLEEKSLSKQKKDIADWFYIPSWKRFPIPGEHARKILANSCWLLFIDDCGLGAQLDRLLEQETQTVVMVKTGSAFLKENHKQFTINPREESDYHTLFDELLRLEQVPDRIVHLWCVTPGGQGDSFRESRPVKHPDFLAKAFNPVGLDRENVINIQYPGYYSLLNIARSLGKLGTRKNIQLAVVTNNMQEVTGGDGLYPGKATVLGPVKVIPREYGNIKCRSIDVDLPVIKPGRLNPRHNKAIKQLRDELISGCSETVTAYRGDYRWVQSIEPIRLETPRPGFPPVKEGGVYLLTGGLGGIGLVLAKHLAKKHHARLILTGRTILPPRHQWESFLANPDNDKTLAEKIRTIKTLEQEGKKVLVISADVSRREQMQPAITRAEEQLGPINGIIHCAGLPDGEMIQRRTAETSMNIFKAKLEGTLVLDAIFTDRKEKPALFILCSSITSILSVIGQVGYCAANAFLDAFAHYRNALDANKNNDMNRMLTISVNWDRWKGIGIANIAEEKHKELTGGELPGGITGSKGIEAFDRIIGDNLPQVVVSTRDLKILPEQDQQLNVSTNIKGLEKKPGTQILKPRPQLDSDYIPPRDETQRTLVNMWSQFFGIETVGIRDDFFELGGDSLKALILLPKIHKELQVEIPITGFFDQPTIEKLSEYIDQAEKESYFSIEPAEKKEYYALSSAQERLFILQQMALTSTAYNESVLEVFDGNPGKTKLERIFTRLIKRHESLRTSFELLAGESIQRIHSDIDFEIEYYDMKEVVSSFIRPFDLSRAPLLRVGLIKLPHTPTAPGHSSDTLPTPADLRSHPSGTLPTPADLRSHPSRERRSILMVDMHHIISDGISIDLIIKDFKALYNDKTLTPLRIQYKDYIQWQNSKSAREKIIQQQGYWLKRFEGDIPVLNLPTDYPRPLEQGYEGKTRRFTLNSQQTQQLKLAMAQEDATLFMKLLTIFYVFLFKISGQEDIVVGTPIAGRQHSDLENIIGMFANTLALRNYPRAGKTYNKFLKEIKERTLGDFQHQDYPFEKLIDKLNVDRDISRNPVFDVMFILHTMETREEIEKLANYERNVSRFDLTLQAFEAGKNLFFRFEYCTKLFKEESIERFIGYFQSIIASIIHHPHQQLWEIEIISEVEKNRILYDFNNTAAEYPTDKTIPQVFAQQVEKNPDHIALVGSEGTRGLAPLPAPIYITYRELNEKSRQLAYLLMEKGVEPDTIAAIMMERSVEMIIGILGILRAGGAYMPITPDYPEERVKYILEDSEVKILVKKSNIFSDLSVVKIVDTISIDDPAVFSSSAKVHLPPVPVTCLAYIIYTSGSTGQPKGVMVDHGAIFNTLYALEQMYPFTPADVYLMKTSYLFDVSLTELFGWFWGNKGGRLALLEPGGEKEPGKILDAIEKMQVTHINFVPSMFDPFLDLLTPANIRKLSGLKYIFLAGEALPPELVKRFRDLNDRILLEDLYGPTEAAIYASRYSLVEWNGRGNIPIGKPTPNVRLYILDFYHGIQPVGIPGELVIAGPGLARGYLNNPELTAEKFDRDFWNYHDEYNQKLLRGVQGGGFLEKSPPGRRRQKLYHTGDLVRWQPDGSIEFLGRIDHQVKIRGFRIELEEIEKKIQSHHKIKKAVVVTREKKGNKFLCAYYAAADKTVNPLELKQFLAQCLPDYMIPVYFVPMETIPMTPTGKVERRFLPEPGVELLDDQIKPDTPMEKIIAETWKEVLGIDKIGVHTRFFDLGGNSVNILKVHSKLKETIKADFPLMVIFKYPTVYSLAGYLSSAGMGGDDSESTQTRQLDLEKAIMKQALQKLGTGMGQMPRD
jgi:amino acid adenylation domain-containing protein